MLGNYSLDDLPRRAAAALAAHPALIAELNEKYLDRKRGHVQRHTPTLAIVGMGRAGKDTAAEILCQEFALAPPKSSSLVVLPFVAHMAGLPADAVYPERHTFRDFWLNACHALRADDPTLLARWCLGSCDFAIGLRGRREFAEVVATNIVDLTVWVDNGRVPVDPTVEFTRDDCDVVIDNHTTLPTFRGRLIRFGRFLFTKEF